MRVKYICVFKDFSYGVVLVSMFDWHVRKIFTKESDFCESVTME